MSIINCECGKSLAAKPEWAGISIRCAGCGRSHSLNAGPPAPPAAPEVEASPLKSCPHCSGLIQPAAIKCRHCGRMLDERPRQVSRFRGVPAPDDSGTGALVVGILGWMVCGLLFPVAWRMGAAHEARCRARGVEPTGAGKAGKILGMIGTILLLVGACFLLLAVVMGGGRR